jgi:hypothetical protein
MGVRETVSRHRTITIVLTLVVIASAVALAARQFMFGDPYAAAGGRSYFTTDNGKTTFVETNDKLPPFDHDGKPAVRAIVFSCDKGATQFVAYLERYTPQGKQAAQEMLVKMRQPRARPEYNPALLNNIEVKRPEDAEWTRQSDTERAAKIMDPKCPHGGAHQPEPMLP